MVGAKAKLMPMCPSPCGTAVRLAWTWPNPPMRAIREKPTYKRAYVVLGGPKWTLRDYYVEKIQQHLVGTEAVKVLSLEAFVALANEGKL